MVGYDPYKGILKNAKVSDLKKVLEDQLNAFGNTEVYFTIDGEKTSFAKLDFYQNALVIHLTQE